MDCSLPRISRCLRSSADGSSASRACPCRSVASLLHRPGFEWTRVVDGVVVRALSLRVQRLRRESETRKAAGFRHLPAPLVARESHPHDSEVRRFDVVALTGLVRGSRSESRSSACAGGREVLVAGANHGCDVRFTDAFAEARRRTACPPDRDASTSTKSTPATLSKPPAGPRSGPTAARQPMLVPSAFFRCDQRPVQTTEAHRRSSSEKPRRTRSGSWSSTSGEARKSRNPGQGVSGPAEGEAHSRKTSRSRKTSEEGYMRRLPPS